MGKLAKPDADAIEWNYLIPQIPLGIEDRERQEQWRLRQLEVLSEYWKCGNVEQALATVHAAPWMHRKWLRVCPDYQKAYDTIREILADRLEGKVYDRAVNGITKPVISNGKVIDTTIEYDVAREHLMLKGLRPEVYGAKASIESETLDQVTARLARLFSKMGIAWDASKAIDAEFASISSSVPAAVPPPGGGGRIGAEGGGSNPIGYSGSPPIANSGTPAGGSHLGNSAEGTPV